MTKVVIIGGGWSGCAAAVSAVKAGAEVILFFLGSGMVRPDNSPVPLSGTNDCMKFIIKQCD